MSSLGLVAFRSLNSGFRRFELGVLEVEFRASNKFRILSRL